MLICEVYGVICKKKGVLDSVSLCIVKPGLIYYFVLVIKVSKIRIGSIAFLIFIVLKFFSDYIDIKKE